jgi:hypothetical protein
MKALFLLWRLCLLALVFVGLRYSPSASYSLLGLVMIFFLCADTVKVLAEAKGRS